MKDLTQKLLSVEYDFGRKREGSPEDVLGMCRGYFVGVFFFSGTVIVRNDINVFLGGEGNHVLVSNRRNINVTSLHINPIKKIEELEGKAKDLKDILEDRAVYLDIQPTDNLYIDGIKNNAFCLVIEDARKRKLAAFEFLKEGEMLYVPKKNMMG